MSSSTLRIPVARAFRPLLEPARYKGAYGGRVSGKSHFFAGNAVQRCLMQSGTRIVCVREVQRSLKESAKRLIEDKIQAFKLGSSFRILNDSIVTPGDGIISFQGMQDHTAESVKSLEGFDVAWVEEGQTLSARSLEFLRPTIRKPDSELWFGWNPRNANDPVDSLLRGLNPPVGSIVVPVNYMDNPWFPEEMHGEREHDEQHNRERCGHIWLGEYEPMAVGAIWDRVTIHQGRRSDAPAMKRIVVSVDPAVSNTPNSDEHGITVEGLGVDNRGYVLADASMKGSPTQWATRAVGMLDEWDADCIVAEINQGGDMVEHTIHTVRPGVKVKQVRAVKGKYIRAEPIASLYGRGVISHVGTFNELEDQMCRMVAGGYDGEGSPDRVCSMVWGFTELFPDLTKKKVQKQTGPIRANSHYDSRNSWRR